MAETTHDKYDRWMPLKFLALMLVGGMVFGAGWEAVEFLVRQASGPEVVYHLHYDAEEGKR